MPGPFTLPDQQIPEPILDVDRFFVGVNMKMIRSQLIPGYVARSENKRYRDLTSRDRPGTRTPIFANPGLATAYIGSGVYSNPNGQEVTLFAVAPDAMTATYVMIIRSGAPADRIPVVDNLFGKKVEFSQQFNDVLLHTDDPDQPVLMWDGLDPNGFIETAMTGDSVRLAATGIVGIPNCPWTINHRDRAWGPIPNKPGYFFASDEQNYTIYDSILHQFPTGSGSADELIGLYPWGAYILIGKGKSFAVLGPLAGDLGDNWLYSIDLANSLGVAFSPASDPPPQRVSVFGPDGVGIHARKSGIFVGNNEFHFLSDAGGGGIYRITGSAAGPTLDPNPVSDPIEPLLRRINWQTAGGAIANVDGIYELFAVPIDGALFNNAILVRNLVTGQWEGAPDMWYSRQGSGRSARGTLKTPSALRIDNLLGFHFYGRRRVWAISHVEAAARLLYEGREDQLAVPDAHGVENATYPVVGLVETRGYAKLGQDANMDIKFNAFQLNLSTYDCNATITEIRDGVNDETSKPTLMLDRTQYSKQGMAPYQVDNINADFMVPNRLDYSIRCGDGFLPQTEPTPIEVEQQFNVEYSLDRRSRFVSYRLESDGGSAALVATSIESRSSGRGMRKT